MSKYEDEYRKAEKSIWVNDGHADEEKIYNYRPYLIPYLNMSGPRIFMGYTAKDAAMREFKNSKDCVMSKVTVEHIDYAAIGITCPTLLDICKIQIEHTVANYAIQDYY